MNYLIKLIALFVLGVFIAFIGDYFFKNNKGK